MKPLQFTCILRLSKSQMQENGFKDTLIESIYAQLLEYLSCQSHSIAFPDLSLFCVMQIKKFLKVCHVTNYCKKMRQILEKIQQTNAFIEKERKSLSVSLTDSKQIEAWQTLTKNKGTPLTTYYDEWNKIRTIKKNKLATENDKIGEYNLPIIRKTKKEKPDSEIKNPPNPFPSDSESDNEFNFGESDDEKSTENERKTKRGARGKGKTNKKLIRRDNDSNSVSPDGSDVEDLIEDIKLSEW
ncbi:nucleolar complex protein 2 homolog [Agrilus planipennis]|nr:nucleolar complex protein 2 homolog [Agrilus planipennis]